MLAALTKGAARGLPPSAFVIWSREKRSRPPNRETRLACWSSTLTGGGFVSVFVFVRVAAAGLLARVSVLTGVVSALTVTLVGLLALRVVAAGRARFSALGVFFFGQL